MSHSPALLVFCLPACPPSPSPSLPPLEEAQGPLTCPHSPLYPPAHGHQQPLPLPARRLSGLGRPAPHPLATGPAQGPYQGLWVWEPIREAGSASLGVWPQQPPPQPTLTVQMGSPGGRLLLPPPPTSERGCLSPRGQPGAWLHRLRSRPRQ